MGTLKHEHPAVTGAVVFGVQPSQPAVAPRHGHLFQRSTGEGVYDLVPLL
jgi:hypothetical protein